MTKEINVAQIQTALLLPITGQFIVDKLGIKPLRREKRAMFWSEEDFTHICQGLIQHIGAVRNADFDTISRQPAKTKDEPLPHSDSDSQEPAGEVEDFFS